MVIKFRLSYIEIESTSTLWAFNLMREETFERNSNLSKKLICFNGHFEWFLNKIKVFIRKKEAFKAQISKSSCFLLLWALLSKKLRHVISWLLFSHKILMSADSTKPKKKSLLLPPPDAPVNPSEKLLEVAKSSLELAVELETFLSDKKRAAARKA